ncbi:chromosome partitioning protein ParB [Streptomyces montanus]|uniref:Chromosome partitioning protein ParB n=2 Tax=Streptomyces montanus TaxID=2580423 RepID=A0A5R9FKP2_9ACTN|nr:chromosome partitioning protein ParB [Streptomyces montanus]
MPSFPLRAGGENPEHVQLLAQTDGEVDPLLVHRPTMRVIDGTHRLRALVSQGRTDVAVRFFDGSEADAFVLAVQLNTRHGLPLTLAERKAAAQRILGSHSHWSDRAIAERTGLNAKTVGRIRRLSEDPGTHSDSRMGLDGKVRPVSTVEGRRSAALLLTAHPDISLRELSRRTGLALGTVKDVRERLARGQDPIPDRLRNAARRSAVPAAPEPARTRPETPPADTVANARVQSLRVTPGPERSRTDSSDATATVVRKLVKDPSLRATEPGRQLLRLLLATELEPTRLSEIAETVPTHSIPLIRTVALQRAEEWRRLADQVAQKFKETS